MRRMKLDSAPSVVNHWDGWTFQAEQVFAVLTKARRPYLADDPGIVRIQWTACSESRGKIDRVAGYSGQSWMIAAWFASDNRRT